MTFTWLFATILRSIAIWQKCRSMNIRGLVRYVFVGSARALSRFQRIIETILSLLKYYSRCEGVYFRYSKISTLVTLLESILLRLDSDTSRWIVVSRPNHRIFVFKKTWMFPSVWRQTTNRKLRNHMATLRSDILLLLWLRLFRDLQRLRD